jgi:hypothetical protein
MKEDSKEVKDILGGFNSSDTEVILDSIKKNRVDGNAKTFTALLQLLKNTDEPLVEAAIIQFLFDLKDEESIPVLVSALEDEEMSFYDSFLISAFWQSAIDGSPHLNLFVKKAIKGDYMTALEALTVVENFDAQFGLSDLEEYGADLDIAIDNEQNEDKKAILVSMADVVRNLPVEGE